MLFHQHKIIRRQILKARQFDFHFGGCQITVEVQFHNRGRMHKINFRSHLIGCAKNFRANVTQLSACYRAKIERITRRNIKIRNHITIASTATKNL
jgi:hypothetical protein